MWSSGGNCLIEGIFLMSKENAWNMFDPVNDDGKNFQCPPSLKSLDGTFTVAYVDILSGQSGQSLSTGSNNIIPVCQCILNPYTFRKHERLSMLDNQQNV
ncbi:hypothetical protein C1H46_036806 [Malus baccata]|uniref:Uncharacterized protein n=1 Tax=Malus baccata TaxID=106549 RepID=A0A540KU00_MALBA|nr:hypothetical protein C1H46_036806 [Malus baccata]